MIDENVKYKQRRYGVSREAVRLSAVSSNKINQSEYLTGKDILPSGPSQKYNNLNIYIYSPLGKQLRKQIKFTKDQKRNYVDNGLDWTFGNQTILTIENIMKILVASTKN